LRSAGPVLHELWQRYVDKYHAADFGVGGDRTDHVLWRIANGELDGIHPKIVVLLIGTNNIGRHTADQVIAGETKIVQQIHEKLPETKVLIIGIFPRSEDPAKKGVKHAHEKIKAIDAALARLDDGNKTRYLYFGDKYIDANGEVDKTLLPDFLHPNAKGYQIWADAMEPLLDQMLQ
jgi:lysophospholipase L1-like esterase